MEALFRYRGYRERDALPIVPPPRRTYVVVSQGGYEPGNRFTMQDGTFDDIASDDLEQAKTIGGTVYLCDVLEASPLGPRFEVVRQVWPETDPDAFDLDNAQRLGIEPTGAYSDLRSRCVIKPGLPAEVVEGYAIADAVRHALEAVNKRAWALDSALRSYREALAMDNVAARCEALDKVRTNTREIRGILASYA